MKDILIESLSHELFTSPYVEFIADTGICLIKGESFMDDSFTFYTELIDWIHDYFKNEKNEQIKLILKLTYYNTSSSKMLYNMIIDLSKYKEKNKNVIIEWYYNKNDVEIIEDIEDFLLETKADIKLIPE